MESVGIYLGTAASLIAIVTFIWALIKKIPYLISKWKEPKDVNNYISSIKHRVKYSIAIVDDELSGFPIDYIKGLGFDVSTYESISLGEIDRLKSFDLIFLDVKGVVKEDPETGGVKLLDLLKKAKSSIVVVAVSSGRYQLSLNEFFENSDDMMTKPIDEMEIGRVIKELVDSKIDVDKISQKLDEVITCTKSTKEKLIHKTVISYLKDQVSTDELQKSIHNYSSHKYSRRIIELAELLKGRLNFDK